MAENNGSSNGNSGTKPQSPMSSVNTPPVPTISQRSGDKGGANKGGKNG